MAVQPTPPRRVRGAVAFLTRPARRRGTPGRCGVSRSGTRATACPAWHCLAMIRHPRIARAAVPALVLALIAAACGGAKPAATASAPAAAAAAPATAAPARAASTDPDEAPLPLWPEVKHGRLANGLTYYVLAHKKPEKRAFLWLAVNAGSIQEDDDQRGLAHFDEHMAFNGSRRFPKADIVNYLEKIGMRFGADLNARTGFDDTVYELE